MSNYAEIVLKLNEELALFRKIQRSNSGIEEISAYSNDYNHFFNNTISEIKPSSDHKAFANFIAEAKGVNEFTTAVVKFHAAVNNPDNDPTKIDIIKKDKKTKEIAENFIPTMKKLIAQSCSALKIELQISSPASRIKAINFLTNTLQHTTALVNDKSKSPTVLQTVLKDIKLTEQGSVTKLIQKHHHIAEVIATVMLGAAFVICGAIISALTLPVGGPVVGLPMMAIGAALLALGGMLAKTAGITLTDQTRYGEDGPFIRVARKSSLGEISDGLKSLINAKKTLDVYTKAEQALKVANAAIPGTLSTRSLSVFAPTTPVSPPEYKQGLHKRSKSH
jgi:hypothetical protein